MTHTTDSPIQDFSHCHEGIVKKLELLGELPALLAPVERARHIAATALDFFREAIVEHHTDEERELFPAVLASAQAGDEKARVQAMVTRLGNALHEGRFEDGLTKALEEVSAVLVAHFPESPEASRDEPNQLPDEPVLR